MRTATYLQNSAVKTFTTFNNHSSSLFEGINLSCVKTSVNEPLFLRTGSVLGAPCYAIILFCLITTYQVVDFVLIQQSF